MEQGAGVRTGLWMEEWKETSATAALNSAVDSVCVVRVVCVCMCVKMSSFIQTLGFSIKPAQQDSTCMTMSVKPVMCRSFMYLSFTKYYTDCLRDLFLHQEAF